LFFLFGFFLPSVTPEGKYSVWSAEGLPNTFEAGSWWAGGQMAVAGGSVDGLWWHVLSVNCGMEKPSTG
jgi:hypothetical protein